MSGLWAGRGLLERSKDSLFLRGGDNERTFTMRIMAPEEIRSCLIVFPSFPITMPILRADRSMESIAHHPLPIGLARGGENSEGAGRGLLQRVPATPAGAAIDLDLPRERPGVVLAVIVAPVVPTCIGREGRGELSHENRNLKKTA